MTLEEWRSALLGLKEFVGRYWIQFVGGEPFVRRGFLDLLEFCRQESIDFGVITNGSSLGSRKVVTRLVAARPLKLDVSVDGPTPELHDYLRGRPGSLRTIEGGLRNLKEVQREQKVEFPIRIKATVNARNYRAMPDLVAWAAAHGASTIDFAPIRQWTDESKGELWPQPELLDDMDQVLKRLIAMKEAGRPIETTREKLLGMTAHFRGEPAMTQTGSCRVGLRTFAISASGIVQACDQFQPLGDLRTQTVAEIWGGAIAREVRRQTTACTRGCVYGCFSRRLIREAAHRGKMVFMR